MSQLAPELGQLKNLKKLDLYGMKLRVLPASIGQLSQLRVLDLRFNEFHSQELPREIFSLNSLEKLLLANNQLSEIPREIANV